ncbi:MAG: PSD1 domain-containing protein [Verrucomicrobia subdivision 3 bacterium]|nr:PSD1 domain-containing protein [Limisphaerales bacterium]
MSDYLFTKTADFRIFCFVIVFLPASSNAAPIDFAKEIQPIFAQHCTECHGPDKQKAGLNLADSAGLLAKLKSGEHAVVPGKPNQSALIYRLTTTNADEQMPPTEKGKPLPPTDIAKIRQWIIEGGRWSQHWAYRPLDSKPPAVNGKTPARNQIDWFIYAKLKAASVPRSPAADRPTLIKRLSYDLLGLPPTPKEVNAFVNDKSADAYSKLVDRLLASPHYGERWGRHWLDKARYADSDGFEKDRPRMNAWRYRDWVIDAINSDFPFDQFTIEQLAGDLLPNATDAQKLATAFNRQTLTNTEGGTDKEQWRVAAVMDRVETVGAVWLGLTATCARCHTHKYDQFTQKEYYQLFAYFNNGDETNTDVPRSKREYESWLKSKAAHDQRIALLQNKIAARDATLKTQLPKFEQQLRAKIDARVAEPIAFHPLKPITQKGPKDVQFKSQTDGSFLVTGANPPKANYTLEFSTDTRKITGLKIEALPDKSLNANGPGRTAHGNFVLNNISVYATDGPTFDAKKHRVKLSGARAGFAQDKWPAGNAIDGKIGEGNKGTGWAIGPQFGKPHHLILTTAKAIPFKGTTKIQVVLEQQYGSRHTLGRFRITARTGQSAGDGIPAAVVKTLNIEPGKRTPAQAVTLLDYFRDQDAEARKLQAELKQPAPKSPLMSVRVISQRTNSPRATHVMHRGEFKQPRDKVSPDTLSTLPKSNNRADGDRLDLARWLVNGKNPLVPRVTANQIWANLFGEGIVRTLNDFGVRGDAPTHPELLDWLAAELVKRKWSRKAMIRLIVNSATYRQSSAHRPEMVERDPSNLLLHRQNRFRVEAEIIRDLNLAASGLFASKIGGPSVFPPLPSGVASLSYANNFKWATSKDDDRYRRGLYTFFKRTSPHPNLITFDCPDSNVTCVKRTRSNTPLAALATLNNAVFDEAAKALATRLLKEEPTDAGRISLGFKICVARDPTADEHAALTNLLKQTRAYYATHLTEAKIFNGDAEASAWAATTRVLLNLDEFITRE